MSICVRGQEGQSGPKTPLQSPEQGVIDRASRTLKNRHGADRRSIKHRRSRQPDRRKRVGKRQVCRENPCVESLGALKWRTGSDKEQVITNDRQIVKDSVSSPDHHLACGIGSERETKPWSKI